MLKQLLLVAAPVLLLTAACGKKEAKSPVTNQTPQGPTLVEGIVLQPSQIQNKIEVTGNLLPFEEVTLRPEASGRIVQLNFKEGEQVAKGKLLFKINDADLRAQLLKANVSLDLAKQDEQRKKELLGLKALPQEDYDRALTEVKRAEADVELLKAQIEKTEIRAPFAGVIGLRNISEGSFVSPGMDLVALIQADPIKLEFSVPEKYSKVISMQSSVSFTIDGLRDTFNARIYAIDPQIDTGNRTFKVRGTCPNPRGILKKGSFAYVSVRLENIPQAIMVPASAVVPEIRGQKLLTIKEGIVTSQLVQTGVRTEDQVQIIEGVRQGDTVITSGLLQLKEGMAVTLKQ